MDLRKVANLYSENLKKHGIDPKSVGWTKEGSQQLRFGKLLGVVENKYIPFTLNEVGCGYGEMFKYCRDNNFPLKKYYGYEISKEMIDAAEKYIGGSQVYLYQKSKLETHADYSVTSGIFNVKFDEPKVQWEKYVKTILLNMFKHSEKGIAFNMLTTYVDYEAPDLYYGNPSEYFHFCKKELSKKVNLIHDYELFEFTIQVRKN